MPASLLWSTGAAYSVSAVAAGPIETIISIPATTPQAGTSASLFVLVASASPGSGASVSTGHALYTANFVATGTFAPVALVPTIGQYYPITDVNGFGAYALFLTDAGIALGGQLAVTVNLGADSLGLSDAGAIGVCVVDHQLPPGFEPWWYAVVGGTIPNPTVGTSVSFQMPADLGPFLSLMALTTVSASTGHFAATDDITLTPVTDLDFAANGATVSLAPYISPYAHTSTEVYPIPPPTEPHMRGSWLWTGATNQYTAMVFWLGQRPVTVTTKDLWVWGGNTVNIPQRIAVLGGVNGGFVTLTDEGFVKAVVARLDIGGQTMQSLLLSTGGYLYHGGDTLRSMVREVIDYDSGGSHFHSDSTLVAGLPQGTIVDVDTSSYGAFALDSSGNLWVWSSPLDYYTAKGVGFNGSYNAPVVTPTITLTGVAYFKAGPKYCLAQRTDGSWWGVGGGLGGGPTGLAPAAQHGGQYASVTPNWSTTVAPYWNPVPSIDALNTVKVVTGMHGAFNQDSFTTFLIQGNGDVWVTGNDIDSILFGPSQNLTGMDIESMFFHDDGGGAPNSLWVDPDAFYPYQLTWAVNIVDIAIVEGATALYLNSSGDVSIVSSNVLGASAPIVVMPLGVRAVGVYSGGGAILGSDGLLYTLGATPDGSLTLAELIINPSPGDDILYGTHFHDNRATSPYWVYPYDPVSLNGLTAPTSGGFATWSYRVYALTVGSTLSTGAGGGGGFGTATGQRGRSFAQVIG